MYYNLSGAVTSERLVTAPVFYVASEKLKKIFNFRVTKGDVFAS